MSPWARPGKHKRSATRGGSRSRRSWGAVLLLLLVAACTGSAALTAPGSRAAVGAIEVEAAPAAARASRVVIVSIDGLRPDAIDAAPAAQLQELIRAGTYAAQAQTVRPSVTLPSHVSMLSGLDAARHGVLWNSHRRGGYLRHPTVFAVAAQAGRTTAMLFAKSKLQLLADPRFVSWVYGPGVAGAVSGATLEPAFSAGDLALRFAEVWPQRGFALTFIHFSEVDAAGHRSGWMSEDYLQAVRTVDAALATVLHAIERAGERSTTALIVSSDHGGLGRTHRRLFERERRENVTIPWICVGPGVPRGLSLERVVRTYDTAPTALALLGLGAPLELDGVPVAEVLD